VFVDLKAGALKVRVGEDVLAAAEGRIAASGFVDVTAEVTGRADHLAILRRNCLSAQAAEMSSPHFTGGSYRFSPGLLEVVIPDHPYAAEAALRLAWQKVTLDAGGLLLHASGISFDGVAVVAPGQSGDGKSTLARLCLTDPAATLLSDEIVQVFPDGRCAGTPFRSDLVVPGAPCPSRIGLLVKLEKGLEERLSPLPPTEAFPWLMQATYQNEADELPKGERARRVMRLLDAVPVRRLTFRKDPAVVAFLRAQLALPLASDAVSASSTSSEVG
jgi:hypothetical protein